jgi:Leucine-rich repeat (LRR) protein
MAFNSIDCLASDLFWKLKALTFLGLNGNKIAGLDQNQFRNLSFLEYLNLSSNQIVILHPNLFVDLTSVTDLDISNNSIESIDSATFANATNLQNLFIHLNQIKHLSIFDGLEKIKNIYFDSFLLHGNKNNTNNMKKSIKVRLFKANSRAAFFVSVNLIPVFTISNESWSRWSWHDCSNTMLFIRFNILYNLLTDNDLSNFFARCDDFATEKMFNKS